MHTSLRGLLVIAALVLVGCSSARMPLPASLSGTERLAVEGRHGLKIRERLRFGPYETAHIERTWTGGRGLRINRYAENRRAQEYGFRLEEEGIARWDVQCQASLRVVEGHFDAVDVEFEHRSELDCAMRAVDAPAEEWTLHLLGEREQPIAGDLQNGARSFHVRGTNRLAKAVVPAAATTGYELWEDDRAIGAVEVVNAGAVWLHTPMPEYQQGLMAATAATLLLYEDLRAHLAD